MKKALVLATITVTLVGCNHFQSTSSHIQELDTRIGTLSFENSLETGVPSAKTSALLFNELDFQRATQAYIWATPVVSMYQWMNGHHNTWGTEQGQLVYQETYRQKLGGLTYNTATPYLIGFISLDNGPVVIDIPSDDLRGAVHNMWQVGKGQMTKPGKYVVYKSAEKEPQVKGATTIAMDTNDFFLGLRLMNKDTKVREQRMQQIQSGLTYIDGQRLTNKQVYHVESGIDHKQPRGMEFWQVVHQAIEANPVQERDRMMMDMLEPVGLKKGQSFSPDQHQQDILKQAVMIGEAMTKNIDFNKTGRLTQSEYGGAGNAWEIATASTPEQNRGYGMDLDGRAAWFYEAVTNDIAMHGMVNGGWGQVYLDNYYVGDKEAGLDGGNHYRLHIQHPDSYAELFWNITVYNVENRAIITNQQGRADVGSNVPGTHYNNDGSVTFHFAPSQPEGVATTNWIQTNHRENWFVYFRAYSPKAEFVAQQPQTILPNFEQVKASSK